MQVNTSFQNQTVACGLEVGGQIDSKVGSLDHAMSRVVVNLNAANARLVQV